MKRTILPNGQRGYCDTGNGASNFPTELHEMPSAQVLADINCNPRRANNYATLILDDGMSTWTRPPCADAWELEIDADSVYNLDAQLNSHSPYSNVHPLQGQRAHPPLFSKKVRVT
jgi:hypothetical protein